MEGIPFLVLAVGVENMLCAGSCAWAAGGLACRALVNLDGFDDGLPDGYIAACASRPEFQPTAIASFTCVVRPTHPTFFMPACCEVLAVGLGALTYWSPHHPFQRPNTPQHTTLFGTTHMPCLLYADHLRTPPFR
mgnify:CR=1 FL=1